MRRPRIWRCLVKTGSAFEFMRPRQDLVTVRFDGHDYQLPRGENLAAALLAIGVQSLRETPVSGVARAPFCMMGACFDCLVEIGGVTRQACMTEVREGLIVNKMKPLRR